MGVTPSHESPNDSRDPAAAFAIFSFLWAVATAVHLASRLDWPYLLPQSPSDFAAVILFLVSVAVMLRPSSLPRFLLLVALQLVHVGLILPLAADHWLLLAFGNAVIALAVARLLLTRGRGALTGGALLTEFAPPARLVVLVCYASAAVAKHNTHFLDPEGSCANMLSNAVAEWLPFPVPDSPRVAEVAVWAAVLAETAVPILLLIPRARIWGVVLGGLFHFSISHTPGVLVFDFTCVLFAYWFLFLPEGLVTRLHARWERDRAALRPLLAPLARPGRWWLVPGAAVCVLLVWLARDERTGMLLHWGLRQSAFLLYGCFVLGSLLVALRERGVPLRPLRRPFRPLPLLYVPLLLLVVLNAASPYLGLKTQAVFTMFSNLRTEPGHWNHLYLPRQLRVAHFQDDWVKVVDSSDPYLMHKYVEEDLLVPRFELQRRAAANPELSVTLSEAGRELVVRPARDAPELAAAQPYLIKKLFLFRGLTEDGSPWCSN